MTETKPHQLVPPGGPQGPFWGLLSPEGYVVATQIVGKDNARLFAAAPLMVAALDAALTGEQVLVGAHLYACDDPSCWVEMARVALATAHGESES